VLLCKQCVSICFCASGLFPLEFSEFMLIILFSQTNERGTPSAADPVRRPSYKRRCIFRTVNWYCCSS
jgi:hypothetical protein